MAGWFNEGKRRILDGSINLQSDTIKMMIILGTYSPDPDHKYISEISAYELSGTGYTGGFGGSGRKITTNKVFAKDTGSDFASFTADRMVWSPLTLAGEVSTALLVKEVTSDADSYLISWHTFPAIVPVAMYLEVVPNVAGILRIT